MYGSPNEYIPTHRRTIKVGGAYVRVGVVIVLLGLSVLDGDMQC